MYLKQNSIMKEPIYTVYEHVLIILQTETDITRKCDLRLFNDDFFYWKY